MLAVVEAKGWRAGVGHAVEQAGGEDLGRDVREGHDSVRAAIIYQHATTEADARIAAALEAALAGHEDQADEDDDDQGDDDDGDAETADSER